MASKKDLIVEHVICNCVKIVGRGFVPVVSEINPSEISEGHKFPIITISNNCKHCGGIGYYHRLTVPKEFKEGMS